MKRQITLNSLIIMAMVFAMGCSSEETTLTQPGRIPVSVQVLNRPIFDTDLTYYYYFKPIGGPGKEREEAEAWLSMMLDEGLLFAQAWLGTRNDFARLVVRLDKTDSKILDFFFTPDPVPATKYAWVVSWDSSADKLVWRYDFDPGPNIKIPEPQNVPNVYPIPNSPQTYFDYYWYWNVTEEELKVAVEAYIKELVREGIRLSQVSVPTDWGDPQCPGGNDFPCSLRAMVIETAEPSPKLEQQYGISTEVSDCTNRCPERMLRYEFDQGR